MTSPISKVRRLTTYALATAISIGLFIGLLELFSFAVTAVQTRTLSTPKQLFSAVEKNAYVRIAKTTNCNYHDKLFPHPWLGYVYHNLPPCGSKTTRIGLRGRDFPYEKSDDYYDILILGGSVASQFTVTLAGVGEPERATPFLEEYLNRHFRSPTGMPVRVLNGAAGGWRHPQQGIMTLLYGHIVDAIVSVDGFNEILLAGRQSFEFPSGNFTIVNPTVNTSYGTLLRAYMTSKLFESAAAHPVFSRSYAAFLATSLLRRAGALDELAGERLDYHRNMFKFPPDWSPEKISQARVNKYKYHIESIYALARQHGFEAAFFVQPMPIFGKVLTPEEQKFAKGNRYGDLYQSTTAELLKLNEKGIFVSSLQDIFADEEARVYRDKIHLLARGNERMAQVIGDQIAESWGFERTNARNLLD